MPEFKLIVDCQNSNICKQVTLEMRNKGYVCKDDLEDTTLGDHYGILDFDSEASAIEAAGQIVDEHPHVYQVNVELV